MTSPLTRLKKQIDDHAGLQNYLYQRQDYTLISLDELAQLREAMPTDELSAKFILDKKINEVEYQLNQWGEHE